MSEVLRDRRPVRLESTFLLRRDDDGIRILAYLNHKDIVAMLTTGS
ncbi:hypothetical protein [Nonomuraea sp. NPDC002799]